jgi:hypothetical protein
MKATNSPSAPLILKLIGIILIVSSLIDYVSVLVPPNFSDRGWLATAITQLVDRGIIPMVGIGFLCAGAFLANGTLALAERGKPAASFRFWALLLALLLGFVFLVAFPLHLNNTRQVSDQALRRIAQEAGDAESQLDAQVQQRRDQITNALKDPNQARQLDEQLKQIDAAITSNRVQGEQLEQLKRAQKELQALKANPNSVDERAKEFRNQRLTEIRDRRQQLEKQARSEFWKTGVRVGISSLLLSLGYFLIGWTGLREMGIIGGGKRKAPVR